MTPVSCRMIANFDEDGGGDVDFQEFVSGLSAFSSKGNKEEKLRFAFKVYDIDRDGYISNGELFIVLKMMVGSNLKDMQLQQVRSAITCLFNFFFSPFFPKWRERRNVELSELLMEIGTAQQAADYSNSSHTDRRQNHHGGG